MKLSVLQLLVCFCMVLRAPAADSLMLQIFPGLEKYAIFTIDVLSPTFAIAAGDYGILKWDGRGWSEFTPSISRSPFHPQIVKVLSPRNIWIFYKRHPNFYHTEILHFNGREWRDIPSPQAYELHKVSFIDSLRFVAAGYWSSLAYFDGKTTVNLPAPHGTGFLHFTAFSPRHFRAVINRNEYDKTTALYEYRDGQWRDAGPLPVPFAYLDWFHPDSGFGFSALTGIVGEFRQTAFVPLDTLPPLAGISAESGFSVTRRLNGGEHAICFWNSDSSTLYLYQRKKLSRVARINFPVSPYALSPQEFFLIDANRNLYYLGFRKVAAAVESTRMNFSWHYFWGAQTKGYLGASLYRNHKGKIDIYMTSSDGPNVFYTFEEYFSGYRDVLVERGLQGHRDEKRGQSKIWDGAAYFADIDNDGDSDAILACLRGPSRLYENTGRDNFRDVTEAYGFSLVGRISSICWGDLNRDGNLDFLAGDETGPLKAFIGDGFFRFRPVASQIGLNDSLVLYMPALADIDNDGDPDLLLFNRNGRALLFRNRGLSAERGLPQFSEVSALSPELTALADFFTQSVAFGDFDNDGDLDLFLANRRSPDRLFRNDGNGAFEDASQTTGILRLPRAFTYGALWGDLNNDGWQDLFLTTMGRDYMLWNRAGVWFEIDSLSLPVNKIDYSTGSAVADFDADGDLDLVIANYEVGFSCIYENHLKQGQLLQVSTRGFASNRQGLGAGVWVYNAGAAGEAEGLRGFQQITTNAGYMSSGLPLAAFALPSGESYDLVVRFPSGQQATVRNVSSGANITVSEPATILTDVKTTGRWLQSLLRHPGRLPLTLKISALLLLFGLINLFLWKRSFWGAGHIALFNFFAFVSLPLIGYILSLNFNSWIILWLYAVAIGGGLAGGHTYLKSKRNNADLYDLYDLLRQFKHGGTGAAQLDRLIFFANNTGDAASGEFFCSFQTEAEQFSKYTAALLKQVIANLREVNLPVAVMQRLRRLARRVIRYSRSIHGGPGFRPGNALSIYAQQLEHLKQELLNLRSMVEDRLSSNLNEVLRDSLYRFQQFTRVRFNCPPGTEGVMVVVPRELLAQVFDNLFKNALEAMQPQRDKEICVAVQPPRFGEIEVLVQDSGPGVPADKRDQIFALGYSTKPHSTGLGLFHAREFLRRYGGAIELYQNSRESSNGFRIQLKVRRDAEDLRSHDR